MSVSWFNQLYFIDLVNTGKPLSLDTTDTDVNPAECVKLTNGNIESVFQSMSGDYENSVLKMIGVYRVPLDAPFKMSNPLPWLKCFFQQQFTPFDFHAVVVFETSDGKFWSAEKMRDGVYLSCGDSKLSVLLYFSETRRSEHVYWETECATSSSLIEVANQIKEIGLEYRLWTANCKHFSKALFNKLAENKWSFTNPSLRSLISGRHPLICLVIFISLIFEITQCHYQFLVLGVMLFTLIVHERFITNMEMRIICSVALPFVLIGESVVATPLCTALKRGEHYIELWKSGSLIYKCIVVFIFMWFYVVPTILCIWVLLIMLDLLFDNLTKLLTCNMCNKVLQAVGGSVKWLRHCMEHGSAVGKFIIVYLITVGYFISQS